MSETGQLLIERDGNIVGVDTGFCQLVRRDATDMIGINILEIIAPGDRNECEVALADMVRTKRQVHATKRYLRGDGTTIWAEATASLVLQSRFSDCAILHAASIDDTRLSHHPHRLLEAARSLRGHDIARTNVVDHSLLPAWGTILAAYIAEAEGRLFSAGSDEPMGLPSANITDRWVKALVHERIFEVETRNPAPDTAKSYRLTTATQAKLEAYLNDVAKRNGVVADFNPIRTAQTEKGYEAKNGPLPPISDTEN